MKTTIRRRTLGALAAVLAVLIGCLIPAHRYSAAATSIDLAPVTVCAASAMNIVAHEDDDLLFINPTVAHDIAAGRCVTTVYVTAGDAGLDATYWGGRESGVEASYAQMAGVANDWVTGTVDVGGHAVTTKTLSAAPRISLLFMRLPDGNMSGTGFPASGSRSLAQLYGGSIDSLATVDGTGSYTLTELIASFVALMNAYQPDSINTLDYAGSYDDGDHSDHHAVGYLVNEAQAQYGRAHSLTGYLGYGVGALPANVSGTDLSEKTDSFLAYAAHDPNTCSSTAACAGRPEGTWLAKHYPVASSTTPPTNPSPVNEALTATATASSENPNDGQTAAKAVDGTVDGYPGDHTKEWATAGGGGGSWLELGWSTPVSLSRVVLFDRPNSSDQVLGGTLTFSDGSVVTVPQLDNTGGPVVLSFAARSVTGLRFTVTAVSDTTYNIGLAEIQAYSSSSTLPSTTENIARTASVSASSDNPTYSQTMIKAIDGMIDGYPGDYTKEWATSNGGAGSWLQLDFPEPESIDRVALYDRPNSDDQIVAATLTFSDGSQVAVPELDNTGAATTVTFAPRAVTSVRLTVSAVSDPTVNVGLAEFEAWTATG